MHGLYQEHSEQWCRDSVPSLVHSQHVWGLCLRWGVWRDGAQWQVGPKGRGAEEAWFNERWVSVWMGVHSRSQVWRVGPNERLSSIWRKCIAQGDMALYGSVVH